MPTITQLQEYRDKDYNDLEDELRLLINCRQQAAYNALNAVETIDIRYYKSQVDYFNKELKELLWRT